MAFMNYSVVPVVRIPWRDENLRYMLAFFPIVGLAEGILFFLLSRGLLASGLPPLLQAAFLTVFPFVFTGGFHMDGFIDTMDGIFCGKEIPKKLEVMKDSRAGAFGVMGMVIYGLLFFSAMASQKGLPSFRIFSDIFILSRMGSGLSVLLFPHANEGSMSFVASHTKKKTVLFVYGILFLLTAADCLFQDLHRGIQILILWLLSLLLYFFFSKKQFGGITGDVAGFYVQSLELFFLLFLAVM